MNLKSLGIGAAFTAAIVAGSAVTSAPAQAVNLIGQPLNFGGGAQLVSNGGSSFTLTFQPPFPTINSNITFPTSSAYGAVGAPLSVQSIALTQVGSQWQLASPVTNWISGLANGITFNLQNFTLALNTSTLGITDDYQAIFTGNFLSSSGSFAGTNGTFTTPGGPAGNLAGNGSSYSVAVTAVPTPVLLPGLVALGLGAMRKRKQEAAQEVEA